jgi:hypothetical protein
MRNSGEEADTGHICAADPIRYPDPWSRLMRS